MREILFRGKRISNGEWVYGGINKVFHPNFDCEKEDDFIHHKPNCYCICSNNKDYFVEQSSISEFTGLTDKNGTKIFEGDILDCKSGLYERCEVIFNEFCSAFQLMCADGFSDFFLCSINHKKMEVIGNIHDNPELLGGE